MTDTIEAEQMLRGMNCPVHDACRDPEYCQQGGSCSTARGWSHRKGAVAQALTVAEDNDPTTEES